MDLSDGISKQKETIPKKYNDYVGSGEIVKGSIVLLKGYSYPTICKFRWIVVFELDITCLHHDIIGEPVYVCKAQGPKLPAKNLGSPSTCVLKINDALQLPSERMMPGISSSLKNKEINPTITPIRNLNPYQTRWLIRGCVTMKKEIHHFKTQHGDGKVFSFDIIDCEKTKVRITCFNKIVDLHFVNIQVGSIYTIEGGIVKTTNKLYNKLNSQLEIYLEDNSRVSLLDDDLSIMKHQFSFIPLDEIIHVANDCLVDVIGIVICVDPCTTIRRFDETEVLRRSVQLIDLSSSTINVTLWGSTTPKDGSQLQEMYHLHQFVVLAIKTGKATEYNGKVISTLGSIQLFINPDIEEPTKMRIWFDHNGKDILSSSTHIVDVPLQIPRKTIVEIEERTMNDSQTFQYIVKATIQFIKNEFSLPSILSPLLEW